MNHIDAICLEQSRAMRPGYLKPRTDWKAVAVWTAALGFAVAVWGGVIFALRAWL